NGLVGPVGPRGSTSPPGPLLRDPCARSDRRHVSNPDRLRSTHPGTEGMGQVGRDSDTEVRDGGAFRRPAEIPGRSVKNPAPQGWQGYLPLTGEGGDAGFGRRDGSPSRRPDGGRGGPPPRYGPGGQPPKTARGTGFCPSWGGGSRSRIAPPEVAGILDLD